MKDEIILAEVHYEVAVCACLNKHLAGLLSVHIHPIVPFDN